MNERFSELLAEYLDERDRQNSNYYDGRDFARSEGLNYMKEMSEKMDALIHGVEE